MSKITTIISQKLNEVSDTTSMIKAFLNLLQNDMQNAEDYLKGFKSLYSSQSYYNDVKEACLDEVETLGLDTNYVDELL